MFAIIILYRENQYVWKVNTESDDVWMSAQF